MCVRLCEAFDAINHFFINFQVIKGVFVIKNLLYYSFFVDVEWKDFFILLKGASFVDKTSEIS